MIHKHNYEAFIVDYFDGRLSKESTQALFAFLADNPDLHEEFMLYSESIEVSDIPQEAIPEPLRKRLLLVPDEVFSMNDEWLVAYCEGDLPAEDAARVNRIVSTDPYWASEYRLMVKARMNPDRTIVFPYKERLLQKEGTPIIRRMIIGVSAAAAALLLTFYLWPSVNGDGMKTNSMQAQFSALPLINVEETDSPEVVQHEQAMQYVAASHSNQQPTHEEAPTILPMRSLAALDEMPASQPGVINDIRTENLIALEWAMIREYKSDPEQKQKSGTLNEWKDWGLALFTGKSSLDENPASDVTVRDMARYSWDGINRYAVNNLSMDIKK